MYFVRATFVLLFVFATIAPAKGLTERELRLVDTLETLSLMMEDLSKANVYSDPDTYWMDAKDEADDIIFRFLFGKNDRGSLTENMRRFNESHAERLERVFRLRPDLALLERPVFIAIAEKIDDRALIPKKGEKLTQEAIAARLEGRVWSIARQFDEIKPRKRAARAAALLVLAGIGVRVFAPEISTEAIKSFVQTPYGVGLGMVTSGWFLHNMFLPIKYRTFELGHRLRAALKKGLKGGDKRLSAHALRRIRRQPVCNAMLTGFSR